MKKVDGQATVDSTHLSAVITRAQSTMDYWYTVYQYMRTNNMVFHVRFGLEACRDYSVDLDVVTSLSSPR